MKKAIAFVLSLCLIFTTAFSLVAFAEDKSEDKEGCFITSLIDEKWEIKTDEIHSELRFIGNFIRIVMPEFTESFFRLANFFLKIGEGMKLTNKINCEQIYLSREDGTQLRLSVYTPLEKADNVPGLLWIHGGGYGLGIPEQDISFIKEFVLTSNCVVVAPDYTNSTSAPYPAAFNDCYNALLWLKDNGEQYGMRNDQIFVGGDSAGGGLCAAVTLKARDTGDVAIAFQMPLYPMLDDRQITQSSQNNDAPIWNTASNEMAWKLYLGDAYNTENVSKYASPARETDYSGLPPTLTYVGTIEPFTDETIAYVENLKAAGVEVSFKQFEGCFHGFDLFTFTTPAKEAREFLTEGFMYAVKNYTAEQVD